MTKYTVDVYTPQEILAAWLDKNPAVSNPWDLHLKQWEGATTLWFSAESGGWRDEISVDLEEEDIKSLLGIDPAATTRWSGADIESATFQAWIGT